MPEIRIIGAEHKQDINIPNEPFLLFGRMIPSYMNGQWQYRVVHFGKDEVHEMCFPNENYDYDELSKKQRFCRCIRQKYMHRSSHLAACNDEIYVPV